MKFPDHYGWRWRLGTLWYNSVSRHWHDFLWNRFQRHKVGAGIVRSGKITPEVIVWAESVVHIGERLGGVR